jgi:hypothetical protein
MPDGHRGGVKILNAADDSLVAFASIAPESTENLDAKISSRLAASSYTAPDNASIMAIKAKTDNLPSDPADNSDVIAATTAIMTRLGPPAGASVSADVAAVKSDTEDIKAKTDTLGAAKVTTVSPVSVSGDMQIIRGDDYSADDGASRVFAWSDDENVWPDLDGATITFKCKGVSVEAEFIEGTPNKIRLELTQENTSALPTGRPRFSIVATLANDHVVTLIVGSIRYTATEGIA